MATDDEDYDEVEFWGGDGNRVGSPLQILRGLEGEWGCSDEEEEDEEEEEEENEEMSEDIEVDEGDRMEIFGHR